MSVPERIWLMQIPSTSARAWRESLADACARNGWDFFVQERGDETPLPDPHRPSLTAAWLDHFGGQEVTQFVVQHSTPEDCLTVFANEGGLSPHDALHEASLRFATADMRISNGAHIVLATDEILAVPGLGEIPRMQDAPSSVATKMHPLALYRRSGSDEYGEAFWSASIFVYPGARDGLGEQGLIDLVGRRRLLFNGPNIFLPPGRWRFRAEFSVEPAGDVDLLIEWGHGTEVQSLPVVIGRPGRYEIELIHDWAHVAAADFRISLMTPKLAGVLELHGGTVSRIDQA